MSRTAWNILFGVALGTVVATALGIWSAGRTVRKAALARARAKRAPAPERPREDVPAMYGSAPEGRRLFLSMMEAARQRQPKDVAFLAARLGDRRIIPVPPVPPRPRAKKEANPAKRNLNRPRDPLSKPDRFDTISNIAIGFLGVLGERAAAPTLARLQALARTHGPEATWTRKELNLLQAGLTVLGRLQFARRRPAPGAGERTEVPEAPRDPVVLLVGTARKDRVISTETGPSVKEHLMRQVFLGPMVVRDREILRATTDPTGGGRPRYELTPARLPKILKLLEQNLISPVQRR